jgi:hypothetical protein
MAAAKTVEYELNRDAMRKLYLDRIESVVEGALEGEYVQLGESSLVHLETKVSGDTGSRRGGECPEPQVDARAEILLSELYDRLKRADPDALCKIGLKTKDTLLSSVLAWLSVHKGLEQTSREELITRFKGKTGPSGRKIWMFTRPIILLDLVERDPSVVERLEENSSYVPYRLFPRTVARKPTLQDIDGMIANVISDIFPDGLAEHVSRIDDLVQMSRGYIDKSKRKLGKYSFPYSSNKNSRNLLFNPETREEDLDCLYNTPATKKEAYEILAEILVVTSQELVKRGGSSKALKRNDSRFSVPLHWYRAARIMLDNYAKNQLFYVWKESDFAVTSPETNLSRLVGVSARTEDDKLFLRDYFSKSEVVLHPESHSLNSTIHLPLVIYTLNYLHPGTE